MSHWAVWSNAEFKNKISLAVFSLLLLFLLTVFFFLQISTTNSVSEEKEKEHLSEHEANTHKRLPEVSLSMGKCILMNPEKSGLGHI